MGSIIISSITYMSTRSMDVPLNQNIIAAGAFGLFELTKAGHKTYETNKHLKRNKLYFYYKAAERYGK